MANVQASQTISDAWTKAITSYKRNLNPKELQAVQTPTSPQDIVTHMKSLEKDRASSRSGKLIDRVKSVTDRLVRFSKVIDTMTTSNVEASLIWGSLKLLLTIVHQSFEVYEKICQSLMIVGESLSIVELLGDTFVHSELVQHSVVEYYSSILLYWRKALKFYRRPKIIILLRGVMHDHNSELGNFEDRMNRLQEKTKTAAHAVDMSEAKQARREQQNYRSASVERVRHTKDSDQHRKIVKWLAPPTREASYYVEDFESALKDRHPGTCEWILNKPEFQQWLHPRDADSMARLLWISAIAGAGKTVLSAFIINHCQELNKPPAPKPVLYFLFKNTDDEKNSLLSMTRSLLHQLYNSLGTDHLRDDLASLADDSGKDRMLNDERAWKIFVKHTKNVSRLIIVLDALDECELYDIENLLDRVCDLAEVFGVWVIVTSRREDNIHDRLKIYPCINIQQEDVNADIDRYVNAKVGKITTLNPSLRQQIIETLTSRHDGMFLWVFLMIKELKSLATIKEVEKRLSAIPQGLEGMHRAIILRLSRTLGPSALRIALKVLSWVTFAVRPLRLSEIREILQFEIKQGSDDDDLLYSENDLELLCGSLVTTRNGVLQLIHLSIKEITQERPRDMLPENPCWPFYVDVQKTSSQVANLCVLYAVSKQQNVDSYARPHLNPLSMSKPYRRTSNESQFVISAPFIDYACNFWQAHLIDGELDRDIVRELSSLLNFRFTILWIEFRLVEDPDSLHNLERSCKAMQDWLIEASVINDAEVIKNVAFLRAWCQALLQLLNEHGPLIKNYPEELHFLDFGPIFSSQGLTGFQPMVNGNKRERQLFLPFSGTPEPNIDVESNRVLFRQPVGAYPNLDFFLYDEKRDVFYYSYHSVTLWVQDRRTGRRLDPVKAEIDPEGFVISAVLSSDRKYLGVLYQLSGRESGRDSTLVTSIWKIDTNLNFRDIKQRKPWARRLQLLFIENPGFNRDSYSLAVDHDGLFCTPSGLVDPHLGIRHPLPVSLIKDKYPEEEKRSLQFSGDGRILFNLDCSSQQIDKILWLKPEVSVKTISLSSLASSSSRRNRSLKISLMTHDGNYIVLERWDLENHERFTYLMETSKCDRYVLLFVESGVWGFSNRVFVLWNESLIAFSNHIETLPGERGEYDDLFVYRWIDILQHPLNHQEVKLPVKVPLNRKFPWMLYDLRHCLALTKESSTAFLVLSDWLLSEIDLQNLTINPSSERKPNVMWVLHHQVSSDRRYVGFVLGKENTNDINSNERTVSVQITDLRLPSNQSNVSESLPFIQRRAIYQFSSDLRLPRNQSNVSESLPFIQRRAIYQFSSDLSLLWAGSTCYDLSWTTHEMTITPFSCPSWGNLIAYSLPIPAISVGEGVMFSSCGRYACLVFSSAWKIVEIRRATKNLIELCVRDSDFLDWKILSRVFHPHLPILVLLIEQSKGEGRDLQAIEIDLLTLEKTQLPLPSSFVTDYQTSSVRPRASASQSVESVNPIFIFSRSGRDLWLVLNQSTYHRMWYQIQKSYNATGEGLGPTVFSFLPHSLMYDRKIYRLQRPGNLINLNLMGQLNDDGLFKEALHYQENLVNVRISSCSFGWDTNIYLLSGYEEDEPARVLFVPSEGAPVLKFLPVTMKEILAELDELFKKELHNQVTRSTSASDAELLSDSA